MAHRRRCCSSWRNCSGGRRSSGMLAAGPPATKSVNFCASAAGRECRGCYDDMFLPREPQMTYQERIARDPAICAGQPTIRGTRVLVRVVLGYLAHGEPVQRILAEFPSLTEEDVRAVIAFAAASAAEDLPAPSPIPPSVKVA